MSMYAYNIVLLLLGLVSLSHDQTIGGAIYILGAVICLSSVHIHDAIKDKKI